MALFGRSRSSAPQGVNDELVEDSVEDSTADSSEVPPTPVVREAGPWDDSQDYPEVPRVDLGGLLVPNSDRVRIQVQADPNSGTVSQLSLITEGSAVQIQPYAAPRSGGMWEDIKGQLKSSINSAGGLVEEVQGNYGTELRAQVTNAEGKPQPARFAGVDGPRWFLRLVFLGQAARDASAAAPLEELVSQIVVVRGHEAMPMGNAIALRVPVNPDASAEPTEAPAPDRPKINLPERGPEVTETR